MYSSIPKSDERSEDDTAPAAMAITTTSSGRGGFWRQRSVKIGVLCLILAAISLIAAWIIMDRPILFGSHEPVFGAILHNNPTCQQVQPDLYPFLTGCPEVCDRATSPDEPMYRMTMEWYFGKQNGVPNTAYDKGINFQCNMDFVEHFRNASKRLESEAKARLPPHPRGGDGSDANNSTQLIIRSLSYMHMSLAYVCCLRQNETDWVREAFYRWVQETAPFHFDVAFDELQCWREGPNSITNIIVADEKSQREIMKLSESLVKTIESFGVPVVIPRKRQMPFHVTLMGIRYASDKEQYYSTDPKDDITSQIPEVYDIVSNISADIGNSWTGLSWNGRGAKRMPIRFGPYFDFEGTLHAGIEDSTP